MFIARTKQEADEDEKKEQTTEFDDIVVNYRKRHSHVLSARREKKRRKTTPPTTSNSTITIDTLAKKIADQLLCPTCLDPITIGVAIGCSNHHHMCLVCWVNLRHRHFVYNVDTSSSWKMAPFLPDLRRLETACPSCRQPTKLFYPREPQREFLALQDLLKTIDVSYDTKWLQDRQCGCGNDHDTLEQRLLCSRFSYTCPAKASDKTEHQIIGPYEHATTVTHMNSGDCNGVISCSLCEFNIINPYRRKLSPNPMYPVVTMDQHLQKHQILTEITSDLATTHVLLDTRYVAQIMTSFNKETLHRLQLLCKLFKAFTVRLVVTKERSEWLDQLMERLHKTLDAMPGIEMLLNADVTECVDNMEELVDDDEDIKKCVDELKRAYCRVFEQFPEPVDDDQELSDDQEDDDDAEVEDDTGDDEDEEEDGNEIESSDGDNTTSAPIVVPATVITSRSWSYNRQQEEAIDALDSQRRATNAAALS